VVALAVGQKPHDALGDDTDPAEPGHVGADLDRVEALEAGVHPEKPGEILDRVVCVLPAGLQIVEVVILLKDEGPRNRGQFLTVKPPSLLRLERQWVEPGKSNVFSKQGVSLYDRGVRLTAGWRPQPESGSRGRTQVPADRIQAVFTTVCRTVQLSFRPSPAARSSVRRLWINKNQAERQGAGRWEKRSNLSGL
jgi:hypothetical protein